MKTRDHRHDRNGADNTPGADAIVILGCALRNGMPSPALLRRVERGLMLFRSGAAPCLVFTGGGAERAEADAMRDIAAEDGVPETAMLLERRSRNTFENAIETARLLCPRRQVKIILVTDRYHLPRARLLFRAAGLAVVGSAYPPGWRLLREWPLYLREAAALVPSLWRLLRRYQ